jgi:hypothetical protein
MSITWSMYYLNYFLVYVLSEEESMVTLAFKLACVWHMFVVIIIWYMLLVVIS